MKSQTQLIDLRQPAHAYFFGLVQTDGHLSYDTRNRGKLQLELGVKDADILEKLAALLPYRSYLSFRTRKTNFSDEQKFAMLRVYEKEFRDELIALGMLYGKKSEEIDVPLGEFSEVDYFRGIVDGDGSLGFTENKFPFLSLCTASEKIAKAFANFTLKITKKEKMLRRNVRDKVFNISLFKEDAQQVAGTLYYPGCLGLLRKSKLALEILTWQRPSNMRRVPVKKFWTDEQDAYILSHTIKESSLTLQRTSSSIKMRLWRLASSNK